MPTPMPSPHGTNFAGMYMPSSGAKSVFDSKPQRRIARDWKAISEPETAGDAQDGLMQKLIKFAGEHLSPADLADFLELMGVDPADANAANAGGNNVGNPQAHDARRRALALDAKMTAASRAFARSDERWSGLFSRIKIS